MTIARNSTSLHSIGVCIFLLLTCLLLGTGSAQGYSISGIVRDITSGQGLGGVTITITNISNNTVVATPVTANDGSYSATIPSVGWYSVDAAKTGYTITTPPALPTDITAEAPDAEVDFSMSPSSSPGPAVTISASGTIVDQNGLPVGGATVQLVQSAGSAAITATTASNGTYSLAGLPSGTYFQLEVTKTGYENVYGCYTQSTASLTNMSYTLMPAGWSASVGNTAGQGIITGRVSDNANGNNYISGAVVTATGSQGPYTVVYQVNPDGGAGTFISGRYFVKNVTPGDTVAITTTMNGITFDPRIAVGYADAVTEGSVYGTATAGTVWFTGLVQDFASGAAIPGATVQLVSDPTNTTPTNTDGSFTLTVLA